MTRILHLSDLHFGTLEPGIEGKALALAKHLRPDATVISGDMTQRARAEQFRQAQAFAAKLPQPVLAVPGNHDAPLYNLFQRLTAPYAGFARTFGAELEPCLHIPGAVLQGVNTADPYAWKRGRLRTGSLARMQQNFAAAPAEYWRVAVLHHAPVPAADNTPADIADAPRALRDLGQTGAQIVLSGHTHMPHWGMAETAQGMLFVQVGTAISTRRKTEANDIGLLELDPWGVTLRTWLALPGQDFREGPQARFRYEGQHWVKEG
ncbi:metallophosphoesterase [Xinfangfangia sp. CPCC 101601]|uniref:Metallophosphoesterase n=1 Tax=Pseudogemmobacter lacusdianii TaxID=3069608 RepID=A0ABU0VVQ2_9RHOB|nr:metallophosphoesterase [Xinfangfangia sp. CPCC 101601]MDQ2065593.1 metallophosphoesterase [Xinfangfangia sp. CPCC 101601]